MLDKTKKLIPYLIIVILLCAFSYQILLKWREKAYEEGRGVGVKEGQNQIWAGINNQFKTMGRLELPTVNPSGEQGVIIFVPQNQ